MSDPNRLKDEIRRIAEELDDWPSVAPRVMCEVRRRAVERSAVGVPRGIRRWMMRPTTRYAAVLSGVVVLALAFFLWLRPTGPGMGVAFADVQEALRQVKTAVVVRELPNAPYFNSRLLLLRDSRLFRIEYSNGMVEVMDCKEAKLLIINPDKKSAWLVPGSAWEGSPAESLDRMANMKQEFTVPLGERRFGGRTLVGFELEPQTPLERQGLMRGQVWVDPKTRLPVRGESIPVDSDDLRMTRWHTIRTFAFDEVLAPSLFSLEPPEGFAFSVEPEIKPGMMELGGPPAPKDPELASPTIIPGVGIGKARFGMDVEQVMEALGKPDETSDFGPDIPAEADEQYARALREAEKEKDVFKRARMRSEASNSLDKQLKDWEYETVGAILIYDSRGFEVVVHHEEGFRSLLCLAGRMTARDFTGKTDKGIGIGSTREQIEKAYGEPYDATEDPPHTIDMRYLSPRMFFRFVDGRVVLMDFDWAQK